MQILYGPNYDINQESVVAFGKFDGIHAGHKKLINTLVQEAKADNRISIVYTFFIHPKLVISEDKIELLTTNEEKSKLIEQLGVDVLFFEKFTKTYANISAEKFVKDILIDKLKAKKIVMGSNSTFGKDSKGNINVMKKLTNKYGIELVEVELLKENGKVISSTEIRKNLKRSLI